MGNENGAYPLVAVGGILNQSRIRILKALEPGPKPLPSFLHLIGETSKTAYRDCAVLEVRGLIGRHKQRCWGVKKDKQLWVYSLTGLGLAVLGYYGGKDETKK